MNDLGSVVGTPEEQDSFIGVGQLSQHSEVLKGFLRQVGHRLDRDIVRIGQLGDERRYLLAPKESLHRVKRGV